MDVKPHSSIVIDDGSKANLCSSFEKLYGLHGRSLCNRRGDIAVTTADNDLAALLVERRQLGVGADRRVRQLLERSNESGDVVVNHAESKAAVGRGLNQVGVHVQSGLLELVRGNGA